jgi:hypothetical protein
MQVTHHPPYSADFVPVGFFLFPRVKRKLAGLMLFQKTCKEEYEGALRAIVAADFPDALRQWYERSKKCVQIVGSYLKKSYKYF